MSDDPSVLRIQVDKSHVITLGERLYADAAELVRELVNNAYDADATMVRVEVSPERVVVADDGLGMDLDGLRDYFRVGGSPKVEEPRSPRFGRQRIGQFGIGKLASLAAARAFQVETRRGDFAARVVFDKDAWTGSGDSWALPLERLPPEPGRGDGTRVTLHHLTQALAPAVVERVIVEGTPLRAPSFQVLLNGHPVLPPTYRGQRFPIFEGCLYGPVRGEAILLPETQASPDGMGLEVRVRGVAICRKTFGSEAWGREGQRLRGEVHADFLLVTSDRGDLILSSPEYQAFAEVMAVVMQELRAALGRLGDRRVRRRTNQTLREALERLKRALERHPAFSGPGAPGPAEGPVKPARRGAVSRSPRRPRAPRPQVRALTPGAVVRRTQLRGHGLSCCIDQFGADGPEAFTEGMVVYINCDHPLYVHEAREQALLLRHLTRLLTQEISLLYTPRNPREAYARQSELLRDAFTER